MLQNRRELHALEQHWGYTVNRPGLLQVLWQVATNSWPRIFWNQAIWKLCGLPRTSWAKELLWEPVSAYVWNRRTTLLLICGTILLSKHIQISSYYSYSHCQSVFGKNPCVQKHWGGFQVHTSLKKPSWIKHCWNAIPWNRQLWGLKRYVSDQFDFSCVCSPSWGGPGHLQPGRHHGKIRVRKSPRKRGKRCRTKDLRREARRKKVRMMMMSVKLSQSKEEWEERRALGLSPLTGLIFQKYAGISVSEFLDDFW